MRYTRSFTSSGCETVIRTRVIHYLQAIGYKLRAERPFMVFERGSAIGSMTNLSARRRQARAVVETRVADDETVEVLVAIDSKASGPLTGANEQDTFEREMDGLAVVVHGSAEGSPAEPRVPGPFSAPEWAQAADAQFNLQLQRPESDAGRIALLSRLKSGASWFYWIAGLSIINSITSALGAAISFVVGLGMTRAIDELAVELGSHVPEGAVAFRVAGVAANLILAGFFVLCGVYAVKRRSWAFYAGIGLYILDALLFLLLKDYYALAFHVFALYYLFRGLAASIRLARLDKHG